MEYIIIGITALLGSCLTFFSGFGLGTLLLPVFALFFPVDIAIALTAIVHLLNNLFKLFLIGNKANKLIVFKFGIPAVLFAFLGAYLLNLLTDLVPFYSYNLFNKDFEITPLKICIAILLFFFALLELIPKWREYQFNSKYMSFGGVLSGFFGGLSGHQGALRSAFLMRANLSKEAFIATGVIIACGIDISRLFVYSIDRFRINDLNYSLLGTAIIMAFSGAYLGNKFLKKVTIQTLQTIVGCLLIIYSFLMGFGLI